MTELITAHNSSRSLPSVKLALLQLTFLMLGMTLIVDSVNGFFLSGMGIDLKLSAAFKLLLLGIVLYQIGAQSQKTLAWIFTCLLVFLIGPILTFKETIDLTGFVDDFTSGLKILTAMIIFIYCVVMSKKWPDLIVKYGSIALYFNFIVLFANIILGVLGYGFSSYGGTEEGDENAIGVKGFFYAGNEVSGIFIVLFGVMLHRLWQNHKKLYFLMVPITLVSGLLIATKAAMVAGALLVFAIPIFNERNKLLNLTWLKIKLILPITLLGVILTLTLIPIFESTGLLNRFIWFYNNKGIIGILMSGRDEFVINAMQVIEYYGTWCDMVFGFSKTGLGLLTKNAMEIDPIDMYLWHGIAGLIVFLTYVTVFLRTSFNAATTPNSYWGPYILLINIILLAVSMIAGHILTSGMLAPLFGLVNGLAYADLLNKKNEK